MFRAFYIHLFYVPLLLLVAACNGPASTPPAWQAISTVAPTAPPTPTQVPDIYEQNVHLFGYAAEETGKHQIRERPLVRGQYALPAVY